MPERRPLVEGLKTPAPAQAAEKDFVYGGKTAPAADKPAAPLQPPVRPASRTPLRIPFTSRLRTDIAEALKRASLQRQLQGVEPYSVQEILEAALEPWLRENGHLS